MANETDTKAAPAVKPAVPAAAPINPMTAEAAKVPSPVAPQPPASKNAEPLVAVAPDTAEDPSRPVVKAETAAAFIGYPKVKYHPVYGVKSANDPNEAHALFQPDRNWFDTAEEADAHRTEREAQMVMHNNATVRVNAALNPDDVDPTHPLVRGEAGVVRNSVAATESLKSGFAEPL